MESKTFKELDEMEKSEKIRVLFVITDLGKGGAERYLVDLCSELMNHKEFDFKIAVLFDNNKYIDLTKDYSIYCVNYNYFHLLKRNDISEYVGLVENFKPHIIHTHRFLAEFLSSLYVKNDIVYICHGHDNMIQFKRFKTSSFFSKSLFISYIEKLIIFIKKYRKGNIWFIANSKHTETYYKSVLPNRLKPRVKLFYYGFNYSSFFYPSIKKINRDNCFKILNVGSFQNKKNQQFIIEIAKELKKSGIIFEINILGEGENFTKIAESIKFNKLENEVKLRGVVNNVKEWYFNSDIYLHTAWYEPFGLVFLEAMAAGLPVVCLDGKGNRDIIKHEINGFIFHEENAKLFVKAINCLFYNDELYATMSLYCKSFAKKFDSSIKNNEMISFYKEIIKI